MGQYSLLCGRGAGLITRSRTHHRSPHNKADWQTEEGSEERGEQRREGELQLGKAKLTSGSTVGRKEGRTEERKDGSRREIEK